MEILFTLLVWLLPAIFVHAIYAISLTSAQRAGLRAAISNNDPVVGLARLSVLRGISFDRHLMRVITLRSPWKIYPSELRDAIWKVS